MSDFSYYGSFGYKGDSGFISKDISAFAVEGGALRTIDLSSTNTIDMSIVSELEQARQYKNVIVFLAPSNDPKDLLFISQLFVLASTKVLLKSTFVFVTRKYNDTALEGLTLYGDATIKAPPMRVAGNLTRVEVGFQSLGLQHGYRGTDGKMVSEGF